jgi:hypothetical protein
MPKTPHFAFKQEYQVLSFKLITDAELFVASPGGPGRKGVRHPRQSRGLVFVNRSKRLILEPPKGGFGY